MKRNNLILYFFSLLLSAMALSFTSQRPASIEADVLNYTNEFRHSKGLDNLTTNAILNNIAQKHSENMASGRVKFGHDGFAKRNTAAQKQLAIRSFAENVAFGVTTGEAVVDLWKNSEGHRKNMLGKFNQVGIGVAKDKQGRIFFTQLFSD
ncbi:MAG: CAP domain-containing protein [Rhizobacter sp.]|nr:CAP domain-containing protein [Ferruginibacter sp.]